MILKATKCTFCLKNYHSYKQYNKLCIQIINSRYKTPFYKKDWSLPGLGQEL